MPPEKPIYLDYNATTPLTEEVIAAMLPYLREHFGNPSSSHVFGQTTHQALEKARTQVADLIGANPAEITFTSGGTESNNMAIRGLALARQNQGNHIITSTVEHDAVLHVCQHLETLGFEITTLPVDEQGRVNPEDLAAALRPETILVTIMHANNEVGTIQPIETLAEITHQAGVIFHTDAAQSAGKIPVNVDDLGVDLLSIAGHKVYAPKGVGALYVRSGINLEKITFGAAQENGLRPGTENILEIVGLGQAAQQARQELKANQAHFRALRDRLYRSLIESIGEDHLRWNVRPETCLPNTLNISFHRKQADRFLAAMGDEIAASTGAACHAGQFSYSPVLRAMHVPLEWLMGAVRFSVGRMTTEADIDHAAAVITRTLQET
jgi:cysteine desulfurase